MRKLMFALLLFSVVTSARSLNVLVDPGHGGSDTGATRGNIKESEIVLKIASHLMNLLAADKNFIPHITRDSDKLVSLEERTNLAEVKKADVFISIHANSSPSPHHKGTEIYFQNQMPPDIETQYLANRENAGALSTSSKPKGDLAAILYDLNHQHQIYLSANLAKDVYRAWSRRRKNYLHIRQAPFHVLAEVKIPSVLVETGFVTNQQDSIRLSEPSIQKEIAQILYEGLQSYRQKWLSTL